MPPAFAVTVAYAVATASPIPVPHSRTRAITIAGARTITVPETTPKARTTAGTVTDTDPRPTPIAVTAAVAEPISRVEHYIIAHGRTSAVLFPKSGAGPIPKSRPGRNTGPKAAAVAAAGSVSRAIAVTIVRIVHSVNPFKTPTTRYGPALSPVRTRFQDRGRMLCYNSEAYPIPHPHIHPHTHAHSPSHVPSQFHPQASFQGPNPGQSHRRFRSRNRYPRRRRRRYQLRFS